MNNLIKSPALYMLLYLPVMALTYVLPYFGSNSLLAMGLTQGLTMIWSILHVAALMWLTYISFKRGEIIQKKWLWYIPLLAGFFDLAPILSSIPFVPTLLHLMTLVLGILPADKKQYIEN